MRSKKGKFDIKSAPVGKKFRHQLHPENRKVYYVFAENHDVAHNSVAALFEAGIIEVDAKVKVHSTRYIINTRGTGPDSYVVLVGQYTNGLTPGEAAEVRYCLERHKAIYGTDHVIDVNESAFITPDQFKSASERLNDMLDSFHRFEDTSTITRKQFEELRDRIAKYTGRDDNSGYTRPPGEEDVCGICHDPFGGQSDREGEFLRYDGDPSPYSYRQEPWILDSEFGYVHGSCLKALRSQ